MKRIILAALLLAGVAQAQSPPNEVNVVPACSPTNVRNCIGGADPGRSAWILDGEEGYYCVQDQQGQCVALPGDTVQGVKGTSFNLKSVKELVSGGLLPVPEGLTESWFSAAAVDTGAVTASAAYQLTAGAEAYAVNQWVGYGVIITSGGRKGDMRRIVGNTATVLQLDQDWPLSNANGRPAATDTFSIFEGELPPGTVGAQCSKLDPCLDLYQAATMLTERPTWIWLDAGAPGMVPDEWDTFAEFCTDSPAGRCTAWGGVNVPGFRFRLGWLPPTEAFGNIYMKDRIMASISGSDMTGKRFPIINCDRNNIYPNEATGGAAGVFEADTGETGWFLVQGLETVCWRTPVPPGQPNVGSGQGVGIFRPDQFGKIIAFKTRHGDIVDGSAVVNLQAGGTIGVNAGMFVGIDIQFNLGDFERWNNVCTAADTPFDCCTADAGTPCVDAGNLSARGGPTGIENNGGQVIWIGGDYTYKDQELTTDAFGNFMSVMYTQSGNNTLDMINVRITSSGDEGPDYTGTVGLGGGAGDNLSVTANIINSAITNYTNANHYAFLIDGGQAAGRGAFLGNYKFINVSLRGFMNGIFRSDTTGAASADRGYNIFGRCNAFDGALGSVFLHVETTPSRCALDSIDFEGAYDGQDVAGGDFSACQRTAADPTALNVQNPGPFALYRFFGGQSFDVNGASAGTLFRIGDGQDTEPQAYIFGTDPDESLAAMQSCNYTTTIQLAQGRKIPIGVFSSTQPMTHFRVEGMRNFGYN